MAASGKHEDSGRGVDSISHRMSQCLGGNALAGSNSFSATVGLMTTSCNSKFLNFWPKNGLLAASFSAEISMVQECAASAKSRPQSVVTLAPDLEGTALNPKPES